MPRIRWTWMTLSVRAPAVYDHRERGGEDHEQEVPRDAVPCPADEDQRGGGLVGEHRATAQDERERTHREPDRSERVEGQHVHGLDEMAAGSSLVPAPAAARLEDARLPEQLRRQTRELRLVGGVVRIQVNARFS